MLKKLISYDQQKFKWQSYSYMQDIYTELKDSLLCKQGWWNVFVYMGSTNR